MKIETHIPILILRYTSLDDPMPLIELEVNFLWRTVIKAAKKWNPDNSKHDTLVRHVLNIKSKGKIVRRGIGVDSFHPLATPPFSDGSTFWSQLPLFNQALQRELATFMMPSYDLESTREEQTSLAAFVGRLLYLDVFEGPAEYAVILFTESLQNDRPLLRTTNIDLTFPGQPIISNGYSARPVSEILPVLCALLRYSGDGLANFCHGSNENLNISMWRTWLTRLRILGRSDKMPACITAWDCAELMIATESSSVGPLERKLRGRD